MSYWIFTVAWKKKKELLLCLLSCLIKWYLLSCHKSIRSYFSSANKSHFVITMMNITVHILVQVLYPLTPPQKTVSKKMNWEQKAICNAANLFLTIFNIHYEKPSSAFLWSSMRQHLKMFFVLDIQNVKKIPSLFLFFIFTEACHALSICRQLCSIFHFRFLWTSS